MITAFVGGWLKVMIGFIVLSLLVSVCNNAIGIDDPVDYVNKEMPKIQQDINELENSIYER